MVQYNSRFEVMGGLAMGTPQQAFWVTTSIFKEVFIGVPSGNKM